MEVINLNCNGIIEVVQEETKTLVESCTTIIEIICIDNEEYNIVLDININNIEV